MGSAHDAAARLESFAGADGVRRHLHIDLDAADDAQRDEVRARARRIAACPLTSSGPSSPRAAT